MLELFSDLGYIMKIVYLASFVAPVQEVVNKYLFALSGKVSLGYTGVASRGSGAFVSSRPIESRKPDLSTGLERDVA